MAGLTPLTLCIDRQFHQQGSIARNSTFCTFQIEANVKVRATILNSRISATGTPRTTRSAFPLESSRIRHLLDRPSIGFTLSSIHCKIIWEQLPRSTLAYMREQRDLPEQVLQSWTNCVGKWQKHKLLTVIPTE